MLSFRFDTAAFQKRLAAPLFEGTEAKDLLYELGTSMLSNIQGNFETLSNGGSGIDGTTWAPLAKSTEITKAEKGGWRPPDRKKGDKKQSIFDVLKKTSAGKYDNVDPPKSQIGVDTGMLRNSASPGFAGDSEGGNIFEIQETALSVTVGFGRQYARFFHARRPLLPDQFPDRWIEDLNGIAEDFLKEKVAKRFGATG